MSTEKTVAMVVSEEAYNEDEEMRDLVDLALRDDRVRIIYASQEELEDLAGTISSSNSSRDRM